MLIKSGKKEIAWQNKFVNTNSFKICKVFKKSNSALIKKEKSN